MEHLWQEIVKLIPALAASLVPAAITFISLSNRQRKTKVEAQEIINEEFRKARDENRRILSLLDDEKALGRERFAAYETDRARLNDLITENSDKLDRLESALTQNKLLMQEVTKERDDAKSELDHTRRELTTTRQDLETRLTDIQGILDNLKGDYDQMAKTYDEAKIERARVEKAFQERVDKLEKQLETTEGKLKDVQTQLDALKVELDQTKTERDSFKQKNAELEKRVSELETERDGLQKQVNDLRAELDELRTRAPESADKPDVSPTGAALLPSEE